MTPSRVPISSLPNGTAWALAAGVLVPAAGATAFVYKHGTTTQVTVYAAQTAGTTVAQPLTANASGQFPGYVLAEEDLDIAVTFEEHSPPTAELVPLRAADLVGTDAHTEAPALGAGNLPLLSGPGGGGLSKGEGEALAAAAQIAAEAASDPAGTAAAAVATEKSRAIAAEGTLTTNLASEITRAEAAEATKASSSSLSAEVSRAEAAEALLVPLAQKGAHSGVAELDSEGHLPSAQVPPSVVNGSALGLTSVQPAHGDPLRHLCRWAPPAQESPTVYTLTGKFQEITAGDEEDVLILGAPTASVGQLKVTGGRHIRIVGGEWKKTTTGASIAVINATGSVSFEGIVIDASGYNADAINACGYKTGGEHAVTHPDIYLQKFRVTGVNGTAATTHADVFQAQGPIGRLFVDLLTATSTYQALFIPPQFPMSSAFLSRINLTKLPSGDPEHPVTYLLWLFGLAEEPYPATLDEVYLTLPEGQTLGPDGAWPKAGSISTATGIAGQAIGAVEDGEGNVSWPNVAQVEGKLYKGAPQAGDFVAAGEVGIGYVPKGYLAPAPPLVQVVSKAELTAALAKGNTFASVLGVMFPIIGAESPLIRATEAIATANRGVFQLVRAPKGGSIREVAVWNGATINGEHRVAIFDTGQHVAGKYTVLWESAAVPAAGEGWQVIGDPALAVEPNALLFFAVMNSGTTHLFGTGTALVGTTASLLPAGYAAPRLLGEHNFGSLSFGAAGASITVAQLEAFNRNILIGASVR